MISVIAILALTSGVCLGYLLACMRLGDLEKQRDSLQERNDRLVEAVSQSKAGAPVLMPRQPVSLEPSAGWWDTKPPVAQG